MSSRSLSPRRRHHCSHRLSTPTPLNCRFIARIRNETCQTIFAWFWFQLSFGTALDVNLWYDAIRLLPFSLSSLKSTLVFVFLPRNHKVDAERVVRLLHAVVQRHRSAQTSLSVRFAARDVEFVLSFDSRLRWRVVAQRVRRVSLCDVFDCDDALIACPRSLHLAVRSGRSVQVVLCCLTFALCAQVANPPKVGGGARAHRSVAQLALQNAHCDSFL